MYSLVFPGQGVQRRGMGAGLFEQHPRLTAQADTILGYSVEKLCLVDSERLNDTRYAQPAVFFVNALLGMRQVATHPDRYKYFAGHSLGEYNALVAAGVLDLESALDLVRERAELMAGVTGGGMAAVIGLPENLVSAVLRAEGLRAVFIANRNSDRQVTIAGSRPQVRQAVQALRDAGATRVSGLPVSGPFHTPLMTPAGAAFTETLGRFRFVAGHTPVVSSVTGELFDAAQAGALLSRQIAEPVEWVRTVHTLRAAGVTAFDEVHGTTLSTLIKEIR